MEPNHDRFYLDTLRTLLRRNVLSLDSRVLVVCAGLFDKAALERLGFTNVVMSNVDTRTARTEFAPYDWSFQDAESLTYSDDSFDIALVHSGLHHCRSPHKALLEMYRVARKGVIVFEPCDNWTTRLGVRFGVGQDYEIAAVAGNGYCHGGVRNTPIPNYVYRWTERDVRKTINTFAPYRTDQFLFFYGLRIPWLQLQMRKRKLFYILMRVASPVLHVFTWLFPKESNNFCFAVVKAPMPDALHPWLVMTESGPDINREYVESSLYQG